MLQDLQYVLEMRELEACKNTKRGALLYIGVCDVCVYARAYLCDVYA
jgi:hypothetical protein